MKSPAPRFCSFSSLPFSPPPLFPFRGKSGGRCRVAHAATAARAEDQRAEGLRLRPEHPFLYRIPATGQRPMEFSAEGTARRP